MKLASFLKQPADYFGDALEGKSSGLLQAKQHAPQSGEIIGILKQMLEGFMKDLAEGQKDMEGKVKSFGETKVSLKLEIKSNEDELRIKKNDLADTNEKWQLWSQDLIDI